MAKVLGIIALEQGAFLNKYAFTYTEDGVSFYAVGEFPNCMVYAPYRYTDIVISIQRGGKPCTDLKGGDNGYIARNRRTS